MGAGFRALAEARFERKRRQQADAQLGEQKAVRADTNTRFSAGLAAEMGQNEHAESRKKYDQVVSLVNAARKAVAEGLWNTADAIAGRIKELGGKVDKQIGPGGLPKYRFEAPPEPARAPVDFAGTRSQIFGG